MDKYVLAQRKETLRRVRETLRIVVPVLIQQLVENRTNTQEWFVKELNKHVESGEAARGLLSGVSRLWINDRTYKCSAEAVEHIAKSLAVISFAPGGTEAVLGGQKFMGLAFDAKQIVGKKESS